MAGRRVSSLGRGVVALATVVAAGVVGASAATAAPATCDGQAATIVASTEGEDLMGTEGADVIVIGVSRVWVTALGGDDLICIAAGVGAASVNAGPGDDHVEDLSAGLTNVGLGSGDDTLQGSGGTYLTYYSSAAPVTVDLGAGTATGEASGTDAFTGVDGILASKQPGDVVLGSVRDELIIDDGGAGVIDGGGGNDRISAEAASRVSGGEGDDVVFAEGAESIDGGAGDDQLTGPAAQMTGGDGRDRLVNYGGSTDGGAGNDSITVVDGGIGYGGPGDDVMDAGSSDHPELAVQLYGGEGDDLLYPSLRRTKASDRIAGGKGTDTVSVLVEDRGVVVDLAAGYVAARGSNSRTVVRGAENVFGSPFGDRITGDGRANLIDGFGGADVLLGRGGRDTLRGGDGRDRAEGGSGRDVCEAETTRSC